MNTRHGHLKQFYPITFLAAAGPARVLIEHESERREHRPRDPILHFFLDFRRKPPYKGDTTALSKSGANLDVKGESIDEERNEEESACEEKGCSEEKEVATAGSLVRVQIPAPSNRGRFILERTSTAPTNRTKPQAVLPSCKSSPTFTSQTANTRRPRQPSGQ
jgi:hypothetical protein